MALSIRDIEPVISRLHEIDGKLVTILARTMATGAPLEVQDLVREARATYRAAMLRTVLLLENAARREPCRI